MVSAPNLYKQAHQAALWYDLKNSEDIFGLSGPGFVDFLNSYNSQDIKSLPVPGVALGTFLTQKGKLVAPAVIYKEAEQILLLLPKGCGAQIQKHLAVYLDFSEVELKDRGEEFFHLLLLGPRSAQGPLADLPPPSLENTAHELQWRENRLRVFCSDRWGIGAYEVVGSRELRETFLEEWNQDSAGEAEEPLLEILRIEAGLPKMGVDMDENNLVAEVGLDERATSFNKGCYLGQETTARVRSQGHVNRRLERWLLSEAPQSPLPLALTTDGKEVGQLTSWGWSPNFDRPIGLGLVQRKALEHAENIIAQAGSQTLTLKHLNAK